MTLRDARTRKCWTLAALVLPLVGRMMFMAVYGSPTGVSEKGRVALESTHAAPFVAQPRARHRRRVSALNLVAGFGAAVRIEPPRACGLQSSPAPGFVPPEPSSVPQHPPA